MPMDYLFLLICHLPLEMNNLCQQLLDLSRHLKQNRLLLQDQVSLVDLLVHRRHRWGSLHFFLLAQLFVIRLERFRVSPLFVIVSQKQQLVSVFLHRVDLKVMDFVSAD